MITPIPNNFRGLITISGPTNSGKSKLAEFLIKEHKAITYIATSKQRPNDSEWQKRINVHKKRRPLSWKLIEYPADICKAIESISEEESILIDSLGGLVEQHLMIKDHQWEVLKNEFVNTLIKNNYLIIIVFEEIGWGISPHTQIGHLFRERLSNLSSLISRHSSRRWLAINGTAIDIDKIGSLIP
tara:strand:+ start:8365 stop:8922 length:558 start_codon:yes stop_codon:yes gene_type:complete